MKGYDDDDATGGRGVVPWRRMMERMISEYADGCEDADACGGVRGAQP